MKGARRKRPHQAGFADLMTPSTSASPPPGVITTVARSSAATSSPSNAIPTTVKSPSNQTRDDWDVLLKSPPKRRLTPPKALIPVAESLDIVDRKEKTAVIASVAVPAFLSGWDGADGWGDEGSDEQELDDDAWGGEWNVEEQLADEKMPDEEATAFGGWMDGVPLGNHPKNPVHEEGQKNDALERGEMERVAERDAPAERNLMAIVKKEDAKQVDVCVAESVVVNTPRETGAGVPSHVATVQQEPRVDESKGAVAFEHGDIEIVEDVVVNTPRDTGVEGLSHVVAVKQGPTVDKSMEAVAVVQEPLVGEPTASVFDHASFAIDSQGDQPVSEVCGEEWDIGTNNVVVQTDDQTAVAVGFAESEGVEGEKYAIHRAVQQGTGLDQSAFEPSQQDAASLVDAWDDWGDTVSGGEPQEEAVECIEEPSYPLEERAISRGHGRVFAPVVEVNQSGVDCVAAEKSLIAKSATGENKIGSNDHQHETTIGNSILTVRENFGTGGQGEEEIFITQAEKSSPDHVAAADQPPRSPPTNESMNASDGFEVSSNVYSQSEISISNADLNARESFGTVSQGGEGIFITQTENTSQDNVVAADQPARSPPTNDSLNASAAFDVYSQPETTIGDFNLNVRESFGTVSQGGEGIFITQTENTREDNVVAADQPARSPPTNESLNASAAFDVYSQPETTIGDFNLNVRESFGTSSQGGEEIFITQTEDVGPDNVATADQTPRSSPANESMNTSAAFDVYSQSETTIGDSNLNVRESFRVGSREEKATFIAQTEIARRDNIATANGSPAPQPTNESFNTSVVFDVANDEGRNQVDGDAMPSGIEESFAGGWGFEEGSVQNSETIAWGWDEIVQDPDASKEDSPTQENGLQYGEDESNISEHPGQLERADIIGPEAQMGMGGGRDEALEAITQDRAEVSNFESMPYNVEGYQEFSVHTVPVDTSQERDSSVHMSTVNRGPVQTNFDEDCCWNADIRSTDVDVSSTIAGTDVPSVAAASSDDDGEWDAEQVNCSREPSPSLNARGQNVRPDAPRLSDIPPQVIAQPVSTDHEQIFNAPDQSSAPTHDTPFSNSAASMNFGLYAPRPKFADDGKDGPPMSSHVHRNEDIHRPPLTPPHPENILSTSNHEPAIAGASSSENKSEEGGTSKGMGHYASDERHVDASYWGVVGDGAQTGNEVSSAFAVGDDFEGIENTQFEVPQMQPPTQEHIPTSNLTMKVHSKPQTHADTEISQHGFNGVFNDSGAKDSVSNDNTFHIPEVPGSVPSTSENRRPADALGVHSSTLLTATQLERSMPAESDYTRPNVPYADSNSYWAGKLEASFADSKPMKEESDQLLGGLNKSQYAPTGHGVLDAKTSQPKRPGVSRLGDHEPEMLGSQFSEEVRGQSNGMDAVAVYDFSELPNAGSCGRIEGVGNDANVSYDAFQPTNVMANAESIGGEEVAFFDQGISSGGNQWFDAHRPAREDPIGNVPERIRTNESVAVEADADMPTATEVDYSNMEPRHNYSDATANAYTGEFNRDKQTRAELVRSDMLKSQAGKDHSASQDNATLSTEFAVYAPQHEPAIDQQPFSGTGDYGSYAPNVIASQGAIEGKDFMGNADDCETHCKEPVADNSQLHMRRNDPYQEPSNDAQRLSSVEPFQGAEGYDHVADGVQRFAPASLPGTHDALRTTGNVATGPLQPQFQSDNVWGEPMLASQSDSGTADQRPNQGREIESMSCALLAGRPQLSNVVPLEPPPISSNLMYPGGINARGTDQSVNTLGPHEGPDQDVVQVAAENVYSEPTPAIYEPRSEVSAYSEVSTVSPYAPSSVPTSAPPSIHSKGIRIYGQHPTAPPMAPDSVLTGQKSANATFQGLQQAPSHVTEPAIPSSATAPVDVGRNSSSLDTTYAPIRDVDGSPVDADGINNLYNASGVGLSTADVYAPQASEVALDSTIYSYPFSIMDAAPTGLEYRPPRPVISWGFGGTLVTSFPGHGEQIPRENASFRPVRLYDLSHVIRDAADDDLVAVAAALPPLHFPVRPPDLVAYAEMCDRLANKSIGRKSSQVESRATLWRVLGLMCRSCTADWRNQASSAISGPSSVPMFGRSKSSSFIAGQFSRESPLKHLGTVLRKSEVEKMEAAAEVERLIAQGNGQEGIRVAQEAGLWSLALVVAATLDKDLYKKAISDFAKSTLSDGSALQTLCFSMAENDEEIIRKATSESGLNEWRKTVAMLLTSRRSSVNTGDRNGTRFLRLVERVGDALLSQKGDVVAGHVCYLISGRISTLDTVGHAMLGGDKKVLPGRPTSYGSPAVVLQSLVFEAIANAQRGETYPHMLPFRLVLAEAICMAGRPDLALQHCESMSSAVRAVFDAGHRDLAAKIFTPPFLASLEALQERLRSHLGLQEVVEKRGTLTALGRSLSVVFNRSVIPTRISSAVESSPSEVSVSQSQVSAPAPPLQPLSASQPLNFTPPLDYSRAIPYAQDQQSGQGPSAGYNPAVASSTMQVPMPAVSNPQSSGAAIHGGAPGEVRQDFNGWQKPQGYHQKSSAQQREEPSTTGNERWNSFVSRTIGVLAPADGDLSPPPRPRANSGFPVNPESAPSIGLGHGTGNRVPSYNMATNHMRSASMNDVPADAVGGPNLNNAHNAYGNYGRGFESTSAELHADARPDQTGSEGNFNGANVQEAKSITSSAVLSHRRSASDMTLQSQTSERRPPRPPRRSPAASSSAIETSTARLGTRGWSSRFRDRIMSAFRGPPRAHMGSENKFIFDRERGRWVIEGEDMEQEDDTPPPPPDDDAMFGGNNAEVSSSISYDNLHQQTYEPQAIPRSHSMQDSRSTEQHHVQRPLEMTRASSHNPSYNPLYNPSYDNPSYDQSNNPAQHQTAATYGNMDDNRSIRDNGSETSATSSASVPMPYVSNRSESSSPAPPSAATNKFRARSAKRSGRRAYVDTFNNGSGAGPSVATPLGRPVAPGMGALGGRPGGYNVFTPSPAPSGGTEFSDSSAHQGSGSYGTSFSQGSINNGSISADNFHPRPPQTATSVPTQQYNNVMPGGNPTMRA